MEDGMTMDVVLFLSSLLVFLDLGPVHTALARVLSPPDLSEWEVEFPRAPDEPEGCH
jgi:hypothetical protein